ncbi:MAG: TetR/AcrR family transcriptional regulator [Pseudomonadota bacterium]
MSSQTTSLSETPTQLRLLESAARLLSEEGPAALSARRVAQLAGVSTMGLYTHFGSMGNLVTAVIDEGFKRLAAEMDSVGCSSDPVADIAGLTSAYLRHARAWPHLYAVMFGSVPLGSFGSREPEVLRKGLYTLDKVVAAVERAMLDGRFRQDNAFLLANQWWTVVHGHTLLEAAGYLQPEAGTAKVLKPALLHLFMGMGDNESKAKASLLNI